jgi:hypothetical protein
VAPYNFWNMTKSWFRFNFLKRGFLLEDKNCPHILSDLLRVESCSQKWRHYRCYGNNDVSIWPTFYLLTHFTREKDRLPPFFISWNVFIEKIEWREQVLKNSVDPKKYLSRKITFFNFLKIPIYRIFLHLFTWFIFLNKNVSRNKKWG